jgi:hypothetical protein
MSDRATAQRSAWKVALDTPIDSLEEARRQHCRTATQMVLRLFASVIARIDPSLAVGTAASGRSLRIQWLGGGSQSILEGLVAPRL